MRNSLLGGWGMGLYLLGNLLHNISYRSGGINPADMYSSSFHATEVGHLSLGKLMNGDLQLSDHLVISDLPFYV